MKASKWNLGLLPPGGGGGGSAGPRRRGAVFVLGLGSGKTLYVKGEPCVAGDRAAPLGGRGSRRIVEPTIIQRKIAWGLHWEEKE